MIVKVQIPLFPAGGQALIYDRRRQHMMLIDQEMLPPSVVSAAKITGKAYFNATLDGDVIAFGEQVPLPNW